MTTDATNKGTVTAEQLISATVRYNNQQDASRAYAINADVRINMGAVESVDNGEVRDLANGNTLASFRRWSADTLNMDFNVRQGRQAVLSAVEGFVDGIEESVNAQDINI